MNARIVIYNCNIGLSGKFVPILGGVRTGLNISERIENK